MAARQPHSARWSQAQAGPSNSHPLVRPFAHVREINPFEASFALDRRSAPLPPADHATAWGSLAHASSTMPLKRGALPDMSVKNGGGGYVESPQAAYEIGNWIHQTEQQMPARMSPPPLDQGIGCDGLMAELLDEDFHAPTHQLPPPPPPVLTETDSSESNPNSMLSHSNYQRSTQPSSASLASSSSKQPSPSQSPPQHQHVAPMPFRAPTLPPPVTAPYIPPRPAQESVAVPPIKKRGRPPKSVPKAADGEEVLAGEEGLSALERNRLAAQRSRVRKKQMIRNLETGKPSYLSADCRVAAAGSASIVHLADITFPSPTQTCKAGPT